MSIEAQIQTIQATGYTRSEAQFLRVVALHGGYFVRRQFLCAANCPRGKRAQEFIEELIAHGHASREAYREDRHIFQLRSKLIYEAVGEENTRNRREHQPVTIRLRLMGLDFVLEHPEHEFLATQNEKLAYFFEERHVDPRSFPARMFRTSDVLNTRYFPEGFPQFFPERNRQLPSFVYVDDHQLTLDAFRSYLQNYSSLFQSLGIVGLVFATTSPDRFTIAQKTLDRFCSRLRERGEMGVDLERLLVHFPHRLLYEKRATQGLGTGEITALQRDLHELAGSQIDRLYETWKHAAADGLRTEFATRTDLGKVPHIDFKSSILKYDYDLFGTLDAAS